MTSATAYERSTNLGSTASNKTATQRPPLNRLADWWPSLVQVGVLAATRDDVIDGSSHFLRRHVFCATLGGHFS